MYKGSTPLRDDEKNYGVGEEGKEQVTSREGNILLDKIELLLV
jgi:hypothetical protein